MIILRKSEAGIMILKYMADKIYFRGDNMFDKFNRLRELIKNIDKRIIRLITIGNIIAYIVCLIGVLALFIEYRIHISVEFFSVGITIFKLGIIIALGFVIIGGGFGIIKKMMESN